MKPLLTEKPERIQPPAALNQVGEEPHDGVKGGREVEAEGDGVSLRLNQRLHTSVNPFALLDKPYTYL